jgi:hypothetical protein
LLSRGDVSKPKNGIKLLSLSFIQEIDMCKGYIFGVRIWPLIRLMTFSTSYLASICIKTWPALYFSITLPIFNPVDNFSAKGLSLILKTIKILGRYTLDL